MENGTQMMLDLSMLMNSQNPTVGVLDSHVRTFLSPDSNVDCQEIDRHSFSELCSFLENSGKKIDPNTCSLKMLRTLLAYTEALILQGYSLAWMRGGYDAEWRIINSKDHDVPQNRERVFIIGSARGQCGGEILPNGTSDQEASIVQGHEAYSPALKVGGNNTGGIYPIDSGGVLKVSGYHKA